MLPARMQTGYAGGITLCEEQVPQRRGLLALAQPLEDGTLCSKPLFERNLRGIVHGLDRFLIAADNAAENRGFVRIPENRWPPNEIDKAKSKREKRTKARAPRIAMHIEDRATGSRTDIPGRPEG
jgi:hypothetical protein